ncbi:MAG: hypothetical protein ACFFA3_01670 [Promethearchaeota archaeon]
MGETDKLVRFDEETSPSKFIALIAVLFMIFEAIEMFYQSDTYPIIIFFGILEIILAAVIFFSLGLFNFWKIKIPYLWWLMLIFFLVLSGLESLAAFLDFRYPFMSNFDFTYFPSVLLFFVFLVEIIQQKKEWKASEILTLFGALFAIWDCILVFGYWANPGGFISPRSGEYFTYAFFGLFSIIIMLLAYQDWFDIRIPFTWWGLLSVGLFFFVMVSPIANFQGQIEDRTYAGFGGIILLIAAALGLKDY